MKILCDQMLGTLAKWFRVLGFDTFYANANMSDEDLLNIAKLENRIIFTRDKELIKRGKKENLTIIAIETINLDLQLNQALRHVKINEKSILSRCTICNTVLNIVEKNKVQGKVPRKIYENNEKFWFCLKCNKFYWMGSHYNDIINKIDKIKKLHR
jgi:uncharacterized protein with PIN domain